MFVIFFLKLEGKTVLKFALCYGFQNLQNIVRRVKTRKCDYQYVEIMACPAGSSSANPSWKTCLICWLINRSPKCSLSTGCLNGGGQIKPKTGQSQKELIHSLEATYMNDTVSYPWVS